ncbi:10697_t:CDS:2 [Funneliformis geosporum]|uniref:10697_t:CDS:1 n=1 Tax=Funneliformis geosporum TaxID=1117311 RepID=A0A9W4WLB0_9GLOM|nr:10697_t:CDS:2 [Funneliformis geosporum]
MSKMFMLLFPYGLSNNYPVVVLRLPFGSHTSKEALNTLEIIMHDNFQELLNVRKFRNSENQPEQEVIEKPFSYYHPSCEVVAKKNLEEEFAKRTKGYQLVKGLYNYDTFDSGIEFQFAKLIDRTKRKIKDDNNPNPEIDEKNQAAKEWVNALNLELREKARKNKK